ncbi:MAG TPA: response regulator [Chloroflexota bacterium]|nr:response regulator [Chloroflexota bacterium]HUM71948.1 response regulator [Chloroflexota bacterium]
MDDEPSARQTMEMLLLREGYELSFAADGYEALAHLDEESADVILLDVMMPGMDGFELCERLRRNPKWQHVPIILVTALDSKQDLARGLEAGADDFLHKPYNGLELRARVRSMLRIKQRHDELQTALQLRQDLSNMIVHDIRSPLSAILISCDLLEMAVGADSMPLSTIRGEAARLSGFLTDMLMMAKMEHGRLMLTRSEVDMNESVTAVRDSLAPMAQLKNVSLALETPPQSARLLVDASLWQRVLDNLLTNAIKFSPTGGVITLRLSYPEQEMASGEMVGMRLRLEVIDEGPGIPEEHQETIFDKFKIVAAKRRDVSQVGLGLAFCKMVVEAHDGRIFVKPNTPRGSIFVIEL